MQCKWLRWEVVGLDALKLDLPGNNYPDMSGCIELAKKLNPIVTRIQTFVAGDPDTIYQIIDGQWAAFAPPQTPRRYR